jgi:hypothetical protein
MPGRTIRIRADPAVRKGGGGGTLGRWGWEEREGGGEREKRRGRAPERVHGVGYLPLPGEVGDDFSGDFFPGKGLLNGHCIFFHGLAEDGGR